MEAFSTSDGRCSLERDLHARHRGSCMKRPDFEQGIGAWCGNVHCQTPHCITQACQEPSTLGNAPWTQCVGGLQSTLNDASPDCLFTSN